VLSIEEKEEKELHVKHQESVPLLSFIDRNVHYLLPAILLGALLVRILAFSHFAHSIYGDFLQVDERVYHKWAKSILAGKLFIVHDFGPLPAYVMATIYRLFGINTDYVRMTNIILGIFTCLIMYCIGRDLANRTIGLIACLIAALYKPFIFFSITILKESLGLFLFSAVIYLFISLIKDLDPPAVPIMDQGDRPWERGRPWIRFSGKIFLLGITAGLLINVRQNCVVLLPVFPIVLVWMMLRRAGSSQKTALAALVFLVGLFLSLCPFLIRNYYATGEFRASPAGGFNLYLANNLGNPYPYYRPVPFAKSAPLEQGIQFIIEANRRAGKKLSPGEASTYWTREVIKIAREHPGALAWKLWQKTLALFNRGEAEDNFDLGFISRYIPFFRLPFFAYWFVFPLGMGCLILSVGTSKKAQALGIVFLIYALTLIAIFSSMRIRIPLLVILIPYSAMGVDMFAKTLRKKIPAAQTYRYLIVVALLVFIEFLPVIGADDLTAHYNMHALNLESKGFQREAIKYWQESSAMQRPYSAFANLSLATRYYQRGDYINGNVYLEKVPDDSFAAANKYSILGDILVKQAKIDQAIAAYEKSLQINSGQIKVIKKLISLYEGRNQQKAQNEKAYLIYIESFYKTAQG
jgi:4-amino-4-deoxy-L-arabinose transferase-like glycosyltransferase